MSRKCSNLNSCCIFVQPESWFPHLTNTYFGCQQIHICICIQMPFILHHAFKAIYGYLYVYQSIFSHILQLNILNYISGNQIFSLSTIPSRASCPCGQLTPPRTTRTTHPSKNESFCIVPFIPLGASPSSQAVLHFAFLSLRHYVFLCHRCRRRHHHHHHHHDTPAQV